MHPFRRIRRPFVAVVGSLVVLSGLMPVAPVSVVQAATPVFINEIHYDNTGTDAGEFIEVAGPAGTTCRLGARLYTALRGLYDNVRAHGTVPNQQNARAVSPPPPRT